MSSIAKLHRTFLPIAVLGLAWFAACPSALAQAELIITEINYHPDEVANPTETWEFIEIKNVGDGAQSLLGYTMGGVGTVTFTAQDVVQPGEFFVVAKNAAAFNARYGFLPGRLFSGSLKNSGEEVELVDPAMNSVFSVDYWDGGNEDPMDPDDGERPFWPSNPDGDGYSLVPQNPNVNTDPNDFRNWRPSIDLGGSPGSDERLPDPLMPVFINEIRTRDGANDNDAIEFFNPNASDVNIGDWFLSDNVDNPKKSPVPDGTMVPAGGYLVLENGVDGFVISLSSQGERVFLYSADAGGNLTGFVNGLHFLASGDSQTFSRHVNSEGTEQFPASAPTLGSENEAAIIGPVVITEIMYNPAAVGLDDEFIEIQNISNAEVNLYDPIKPANNWRIEGVNYVLVAAQPKLAPGEIALITPTAPATFRAKHGVPAGIQIFGAYAGSLNNGGEEVALQRPENLDDMDANKTSYINVDVVLYDNSAPWPVEADGFGRSLVRIDPSTYGNEPINWQPSLLRGGSPGEIFNYEGPEILVNEVLAHSDIPQVDVIELHNPTGAAVDIGRWWLSDNKNEPKKFQIPSGTMISSNGYWAVNQDNDANEAGAPAGYFGNAFQISSRGDEIFLFSADAAGQLTGYRHGFKFRATVNGSVADGSQSLGRILDTFGREHFTKQVLSFEVNRFTPNPAGLANNPPIVGPVVFTEINFEPQSGGVEFVELKNLTGSSVNLYDDSDGGNPNNKWSIDGIGASTNANFNYRFPGFQPVLPAGAVVIILPLGTDVADFRAANGVPAEPEAFVIGGASGYTGALNNAGEELALLRPDTPDDVGGQIIVPQIAVDVVNYRDSDYWPAAGDGVTLEKFNLSGFSDDPINWRSGAADGGTPGTVPEGQFYDLWSVQNFSSEALAAGIATECEDDVNGDGLANIYAYAFGYDPESAVPAGVFPQSEIVDDGGIDYLSIRFRRQIGATDLVYQIESSTDVANWIEIDGMQIGAAVDNGDGTETVQFRATQSTDDEDRMFMRLNLIKG